MTTATRSLDSRLPAPPAAPRRGYGRAWAAAPGNALFLVLLSVPLAILAMGVTWTVFGVGIGSLVLVIGVPVLVGSLYVARGFAEAERALLRMTDHPAIAAPDWRRGTKGTGSWARLTQPLRNAHYWMALLSSLLVRPIVAIVTFAIATIWVSMALGGPTYWFWSSFIPDGNAESVWVPWAVQHIFGGFDPSPDPHLWASMLYLVVGLVFLGTLPLVLSGLARLHGTVAAALTGRWESDDLVAQVQGLDASRGAAVQAEDAGLRRLERDLHDGPQQRLVRLQMDLAALERRAADGDAAAVAALAQESRGHAQAALDELRALAGGVAPPLLQDRGIAEAIAGLAAASALPVRVEVAPSITAALSPEAARNLYFVVAELLTNAVKHGGADGASVTAVREGPVVRVTVLDDGHGGAAPRPGGGLEGLARRVQGLSGAMHIDSPAGGPTIVTVTVPISA
ncbi:sensor histidine kinase [Microbacterium sp. 2MCAF23]|uniref:sensor histidine kinase n=1 Tax=Microbacterium sp. 2MCAF23 TaxID=3232985 RepID=UPI003F9ADC1C